MLYSFRHKLTTQGLFDSSYWFSWFLTLGAMNTITTLILILAGLAFQFPFFLNNAFGLYFFALWLFALSIVPLAFLISVVIKKASDSTKLGFIVFVIGLLVLLVASAIYTEDMYPAVIGIINLLSPGPAALALSVLGSATKSQDSPGLSWSDRSIQYNGVMSLNDVYMWLGIDFFIYLAIALYLDNVLPTQFGTRKKLWYVLAALSLFL